MGLPGVEEAGEDHFCLETEFLVGAEIQVLMDLHSLLVLSGLAILSFHTDIYVWAKLLCLY